MSAPPLVWIGPLVSEAIANEANELAKRLRAELSQRIGTPGEKAIRAVLLMRKKDFTQLDAQRFFGTDPKSMRKYGALIDRLPASSTDVNESPAPQPPMLNQSKCCSRSTCHVCSPHICASIRQAS